MSKETELPILVGVGGYKMSGKDALATFLSENGSYPYVVMGMSDPLNEVLKVLNPLIPLDDGNVTSYSSLVDEIGYVEAKRVREVRRLLQVMGTEVGRNMIHTNLWVDMAKKKITSYLESGTSVILTGVRFPNELEMVKSVPRSISIWVKRPGVESSSDVHASETSVTESDFLVTALNDGTLADLFSVAMHLDKTLRQVSLMKPSLVTRYGVSSV